MPCCFPKFQTEVADKEPEQVIDVKSATAKADHVILFLGTGESGKSTFYRQLKILYGDGYTLGEMQEFGQVMQSIVISDANRLVQAMSNPSVREAVGEELNFSKPAEDAIYAISQWTVNAPKRLTPEIANIIAAFWADPAVRKVFQHRSLYHLSDQAYYFFDKVNEMTTENWIPTQPDLINFRVRTTGVIDQRITLQGKHFRVVDVGGQRSERRKWIKHFADVSIVVFVVSISEYDQKGWEDSEINRMDDSLKVFEDICGTQELVDAVILLFFNKIDLFRAKLSSCPFARYATDYQGDNSLQSCLDYFVYKFHDAAKRSFTKLGRPDRPLRHYFTTAIDPDSVKDAFVHVTQLLTGKELQQDPSPIIYIESDTSKHHPTSID